MPQKLSWSGASPISVASVSLSSLAKVGFYENFAFSPVYIVPFSTFSNLFWTKLLMLVMEIPEWFELHVCSILDKDG